MEENYLFQIRVTGILIEDEHILLVKQNVSSKRKWSLPGGRLEKGETIEEGILREIMEETGLEARISKLLYVCDKTDTEPPLIHMTFLLERVSGEITLPTNEFDSNPISDVKLVPISDLENYGFTCKFKEIAMKEFPCAGSYMGYKDAIGL